MLFNSGLFLFLFLPLVLWGYYFLGRYGFPSFATVWLLLCSLVFYGWDDPWRLLPLILTSITLNYFIGADLGQSRSKLLLIIGIATNLGLLGYYKYAFFITSNLAFLDVAPIRTELPIGISFFTFTQIAFLVDAYRGEAKEYNPTHYGLFVTFFPHLIAGPILHHKEMMPQFAKREALVFSSQSFALGLSWFAAGLFKKVALADNIAPYADEVFDAAEKAGVGFYDAWFGTVCYALQIYFDFSGYSDMAIGLGLMFNIVLPLNFYSPYKATSLIEFWRRWHITLSRFLRDYLYIPLGGSRHGKVRRYLNLLATMVLGGLWHGAAWNFVLWGAIHGAGLAINHAWRDLLPRVKIPAVVGGALTILVVLVAWIPFRAQTLQGTWVMFSAISSPTAESTLLNDDFALAWPISMAFIALFLPNTAQLFGYGSEGVGRPSLLGRWRVSAPWAVGLGAAMGLAVGLSLTQPTAFLYFRF